MVSEERIGLLGGNFADKRQCLLGWTFTQAASGLAHHHFTGEGQAKSRRRFEGMIHSVYQRAVKITLKVCRAVGLLLITKATTFLNDMTHYFMCENMS